MVASNVDLTGLYGHGDEHDAGGAQPIATLEQARTAALINELTPAQITANQNDYGPPGHFGANVWRLDLDADRSLTGILGGVRDRVVVLWNVSTHVLTLKHNVTSQAQNRFLLPFNNDQPLDPNAAAVLRYDSVSSRWRLLSLVVDYTALAAADVALSGRLTAIEAAWINVAFNAGDFTASGAGTWTVAAGDVSKFKYKVIGKTMFVQLAVSLSTVVRSGGDPVILQVKIPGGYTGKHDDANAMWFVQDNGVTTTGYAIVSSDGTKIECLRTDNAQWANATDNTYILFSIFFEVN